jgi:hypothetical protein
MHDRGIEHLGFEPLFKVGHRLKGQLFHVHVAA